jgi:glycosyltransferase involved in cell wall biosynthesis
VRKLFEMDGVYLYQWNHDLLSAICTACDLAVIPLQLDDPFAAGKSENKLILFWRMGLPVVTSATTAYARSMKGAGLDMTCRTDEDWTRAIERCMDDEGARRAAGAAGRAFALREHGEDRMLDRWDAVLSSVLAG